MTNRDLLEKKLAFIETCVRELRELAKPEMIAKDIREERFIAHTLQIAIQAARDIASHIISDLRLGEPSTNRDLFELLRKNSWLDQQLAETMSAAIGFRNIIVHGYEIVDLEVMKNIVETNLDDLLSFVDNIRQKLRVESSKGV